MSKWVKILIAVLTAGSAAATVFVKNPKSKETVEKIEEASAPVIGALGAD